MNQVAKSYFFRDYYYIEIYYLDAYGNRNTQYYIYAYEYMNTYQLFKMNKDEYYEYTKYVHDDFNKNANDYLEYLLSDDAIVKDKSSKIYNGDYYQRYNKPWEENIYKELFSE